MAFAVKSQCRDHVNKVHPGAFISSQLESILDLSSTPTKDEEEISCPFCQEALLSVKEYQRHVGRHQEQLALFALPSLQTTDDDDRSGDGDSETHSHVSSEDVAILDEEKDSLDGEDSSYIKNESDKAPREDEVPPRDEEDEGHIMGRALLKSPRESREEDEKTEGSTKMNRSIVSPEALNRGNERFEVEGDFVIVKRRLEKEEIRMYAEVTETLWREMSDAETKPFKEALEDYEQYFRVGLRAKDSVQENVKDKITGESSAVPDMDDEFKARDAQLANSWAFSEKARAGEKQPGITEQVRNEAAAAHPQELKRLVEEMEEGEETRHEERKALDAKFETWNMMMKKWTEEETPYESDSASAEEEEKEERVPMPSSTHKGSRVTSEEASAQKPKSMLWDENDGKRLDANGPKRNISKLNESSRWGILAATLAGSRDESQKESEAAEEEVNVLGKSDTDDSIPAEKAVEEARPNIDTQSWGEFAATVAAGFAQTLLKHEVQFMHGAETRLSEDQKMAEEQARIRTEEWKREVSQTAAGADEQQRVEGKADDRDREDE
jgi:hypothetical protein